VSSRAEAAGVEGSTRSDFLYLRAKPYSVILRVCEFFHFRDRKRVVEQGFGPAYNLQFATDTESRLIMGVGATNAGNDTGQLEPMQDELQRRTGLLSRQHLADGGYMNFASVERSASRGIEVFAPLREHRDSHIDPLAPQPPASAVAPPGSATWRAVSSVPSLDAAAAWR
jgi:hypothetical protein